MIDYRKNKTRYKPNELGSLYIDERKLVNRDKPIIYIGGQMEHRFHILEQTGKTFDISHNMYTGSWFYDYPIFKYDKSKINGQNFARNLLEALEMAKLKDVILITESYGGIIGAYASISPLIYKVYMVHPPIIGTPLANPHEIIKYQKLLLKREKLLLLLLNKIINHQYGFEQDNFNGVDFTKVDLEKLVVIGSNLDLNKEKSKLLISLYNIILKTTSLESDGIVIFDEELFQNLNLNFIKEEKGLNHFEMSSKENKEKINKMISLSK